MNVLQKIDHAITKQIQQLELGPLEILIVPGCTLFGWNGMTYVVLPLVALTTASYEDGGWIPQSAGALWYFMVSAAVGQTVCRFAKNTFLRQRPTPPNPLPRRYFALQKKIEMSHGDGPSFPSGDSLGAGVTAGVLAVYHKNPVFLLIALWASIGRQYWFFHYFLDTVVGGSIGIFSAYFVDKKFDGFWNISRTHALIILPIFILFQKLAKVWGRFLRERQKIQ